MLKKYYVFSHTHWDREWYQTFQNYRIRLVKMMDELIDTLERTDDYEVFNMDGQTIPIEDYLEVRPYNRDRVKKLIQEGRIVIGPWYVMLDEFLVSGESLIRNLQKGIHYTKKLDAEPMRNGYVVDCFGHNSQMPQILNQFHIEHATLFRGIGDYPKDMFLWEGADKSQVKVFKLCKDRSYSNFYFSLRWPFESKAFDQAEFLDRARQMINRSDETATCNVFLMMDGVDHIEIQPDLNKYIQLLNENFTDVEFIQGTMADYQDAVAAENPELDKIQGSLYSIGKAGLNNRVLKNVLSSIVPIKQANDDCEIALTRWSEPLDAISALIDDRLIPTTKSNSMNPRNDFHDVAWTYLLKNHPHDSICGCSVSNVHRDNLYRFRQSADISKGITDECLNLIAANLQPQTDMHDGSFLIYNAGQQDVDGIVTITVPLPFSIGTDLKIFDENGLLVDFSIIKIHNENEPLVQYRKLIEFQTVQYTTIAMKVKVAGLGYTTYSYSKIKTGVMDPGGYCLREYEAPQRTIGSMRTGPDSFDNGVYSLTIQQNGTLNITVKKTKKTFKNILLLEDSGDSGDGWVYVKPVFNEEYVSIGNDCTISIDGDNSLSSVITIMRNIKLPKSIDAEGKRSDETAEFKVSSKFILLKDNPLIDVKTTVFNTVTCHRLRVLFPTTLETDSFYTKTPYDMQKWSIQKNDWATYMEADTLVVPSQGITFMNDQTNSFSLYTKGLYEVSVIDNTSKTVALTLFRAHAQETTRLHRDLSDLTKTLSFEFAFDFTVSSPEAAYIRGEDYRCGMKAVAVTKHEGVLPLSDQFISMQGNVAVTAFYKITSHQRSVQLRLVNPAETNQTVKVQLIKCIRNARIVDLEGCPQKEIPNVNGFIEVALRPKELVTIQMEY